jgi:hypothetical protein
MGPRHPSQKCGFSGVWKTQETNSRHDFEFELERDFLRGLSRFGEIGSLTGRGCKMGVSSPASSSLGHDIDLPFPDKIDQKFPGLGVEHLGSQRKKQDEILPILSVLFFSTAILPRLGNDPGTVLEVEKGRLGRGPFEKDRASISSVTPVGPPLGDKFFPSEGG